MENYHMILDYENLKKQVLESVKIQPSYYYETLVKIIENPKNYINIFKITSLSNELKFNISNRMDKQLHRNIVKIFSNYVENLGFEILKFDNINDDINDDINNDLNLTNNLVFTKDNSIYLIVQELIDDGESIDKEEHLTSFKKKCSLLQNKYPENNIHAVLWFIDSSINENENYYRQQFLELNNEKLFLYLCYGTKIFEDVCDRHDDGEEFYSNIQKILSSFEYKFLIDSNLDINKNMQKALKDLKIKNPILFRQLASDTQEYNLIRLELFPNTDFNN